MNILQQKKEELDRALKQSKQNLKEAKEVVKVAELLQKEIPFSIDRLFLADSLKEVWIELGRVSSIESGVEALQKMKLLPMGKHTNGTFTSVGPKERGKEGYNFIPYSLPYALKVSPPFSGYRDEFNLYAFAKVGKYIVKVTIPIELPFSRVTYFSHRGSTSRSAVTGTYVNPQFQNGLEPFDSYFVWGGGGRSEVEFYKK